MAATWRLWMAGNMNLRCRALRPIAARATYDAAFGRPRGPKRRSSAPTFGGDRASRRRSRRLWRDAAALARARDRNLRDLPDTGAGGLEPRWSKVGRRAFGDATERV